MKNLFILSFLLLTIGIKHSKDKVDISRLTPEPVLTKTIQHTFHESQLIGKWSFLSKENDKKTKLENLAEGKYLRLKKNKKYKSDLFEKPESGKWEFNEELQILELEYRNKKTKWRLVNVNVFGMVLINTDTNEKWTFALEG